MKITKRNYEAMKFQYDPWKQQLVFHTKDGKEMVLELLRKDREFYLITVESTEEVKGMKAIDEKINAMIDSKEIVDMYIDSL